MADAISVTGLVKTFGRVRALDGLDLTVHTGEVHAAALVAVGLAGFRRRNVPA